MQSFVVVERLLAHVPGSLVLRLGRIDAGRGREDLYRAQLPALLTALSARARVESITSSSALEGVVVADLTRAAQVIDGRVTLRNRSEQEFAGYRRALDYLFTSDWRPLNVGLLLHLHRELFAETAAAGGSFKSEDNLVSELVTRYSDLGNARRHHPLLLAGLFVLDLLTIHPFHDGNGRVARALTNALLSDVGYDVGRYVSIEQLIAEDADAYYAALLASTHGWHDGEHNPWP